MRALTVALFVLAGFFDINAQATMDTPATTKPQRVYVSFQAAVGFINPTSVNNYIASSVCQTCFITGSTKITIAATLNVSLVYQLSDRWQLKLPVEGGVGSKEVKDVSGGKSDKYNMYKFTTGLTTDYYFPLKKGASLFLGAGLLYNATSFDRNSYYKDSVLGERFELGWSVKPRKSRWEAFLMIDTMNALYVDFSGFYFGSRVII